MAPHGPEGMTLDRLLIHSLDPLMDVDQGHKQGTTDERRSKADGSGEFDWGASPLCPLCSLWPIYFFQ
jgi:hypothetical protein